MYQRIVARYLSLVTTRPALSLACAVLLVAGLALGIPRFSLDASADSLFLEDDRALDYYRSVSARYGSGGFLVLAYTPRADLFAPGTLAALSTLRDELAALPGVESVTSLLDVPLVESPPLTLAELQRQGPRTLRDPGTDRALARKELTTSPLYADLIVGRQGRTTGLFLRLAQDPAYARLVEQRDALLAARLERTLSADEAARLDALAGAARERSIDNAARQGRAIAAIRDTIARYEDGARIRLSGGPLVVSEMVRFVRSDLRVFGTAVLVLIVALLAAAFRRLRWVLLCAVLCAAAGAAMVGLLGWLGWRPTVVSSNFLPVLLVVTLSLIVHLIVRFEELQAAEPGLDRAQLAGRTMRSKLAPAGFTALTTMVAFASLAVSGIRPVIDFGWMMVIGIGGSLALVLVAFPAAVTLLPATTPRAGRGQTGARVAAALGRLAQPRARAILAVSLMVSALGIAGMARLSVENRFVDYFDESTEIHQGILTLDRALGGTTPLDIVLDAPPAAAGASAPPPEGAGFAARSPWFSSAGLERLRGIHEHLERLPETGKVLSLATAQTMLTRLNAGEPLGAFGLSLVYERLPQAVKQVMIDPYLSADGDQTRLSVRIYESNPRLDRDAFLAQLQQDLVRDFGLAPAQVHLTGPMVLYNNVLQSLLRSQLLTVGFVLAAVLAMFLLLFRSIRVAGLALLPNLLVGALVLGTMGWAGVSLDIMTITVAAIVLGIGVDDTIHYAHRYLEEADKHPPWDAVQRAHAGVGRALLYTSLTIALGLSIFALSRFVPIATFGLLTALAMIAAVAADLLLLPVLLARWGQRRRPGTPHAS